MIHAAEIDALLPQTQCTQCGFAGCRPYAEAIAAGEADINRCPPGGEDGIARLAALLGRTPLPLDPHYGAYRPHQIAVIDEANCIGCTKCLLACPVDAIVGAHKLMHTILAASCTGCALCLPPCPVDCITLLHDPRYPDLPNADTSRQRYQQHGLRLTRKAAQRDAALAAQEQRLQS